MSLEHLLRRLRSRETGSITFEKEGKLAKQNSDKFLNCRHQILDDREFWVRLEYDATRWMSQSKDQVLRRFWIDGFVPVTTYNTKRGLDVEGVAWVYGDSRSPGGSFRFIVSIPQKLLYRRIQNYAIEQIAVDEAEETLHVVIGRDLPALG